MGRETGSAFLAKRKIPGTRKHRAVSNIGEASALSRHSDYPSCIHSETRAAASWTRPVVRRYVDVSLRKNFRTFVEGRPGAVPLRAQFNLLNHTNFNTPNMTIDNRNVGSINSAAHARQMQFGLGMSLDLSVCKAKTVVCCPRRSHCVYFPAA